MNVDARLLLFVILWIGWIGCGGQELKEGFADKQTVLNLIEKVSAENLGRTINDLENFATRYTWEKQEAVADYLIKKLGDYGLPFQIDEYVHAQRIWRNVVVTLPGRKTPEEIFMVIAHYDSISAQAENTAPGADDNGTGTAAALEVARLLKEVRLHLTVKIAFFSNEEQGRLGSRHFAQKARSENLDIRATINLDVIGYNDPMGALEYRTRHEPSLLKQIKRQIKWVRNYAFSWLYPYGRLTVAGRPPNRGLAHKINEALKEFTRLSIVMDIDEDCG